MVNPIPARLSGKRLFTVAEIEGWRSRRGKRPLRPEDAAPQFDAEDGSDRREWGEPVELPELVRARKCLRDVEFLLDVPAESATVRGRIDCLWEDEEGGRHLLAFAPARKQGRAKDEEWPLSLVLAAVALYRQTGTWPRSVTIWNPASGASRRAEGEQLPHAEVLATVATAINGLRGETLPA